MAMQESVLFTPHSPTGSVTPNESPVAAAPASTPPSGHGKRDYILSASNAMCSALEKVGSITPVPVLKEAAGLAGHLLKIVVDKRANDGAFRALIQEICDLIMVLHNECGSQSITDDVFEQGLKEVLRQLTELKELCDQYKKKNMLDKLLFHNLHKEDIQSRRQNVDHIFRRFDLANSITIRRRVDELVEDCNRRSAEALPCRENGPSPAKFSSEAPANNQAIAAAESNWMQNGVNDRSFQGITMDNVEQFELTSHCNNGPGYGNAGLIDESFKGAIFKGSKGIKIISHSQNGNVNSYNTMNGVPALTEPALLREPGQTQKSRWFSKRK